jgi:hypothetical protein
MIEQKDCKHENVGNKHFCPDCGKEMKDEGIEKLAAAVFEKLKPELEKLSKPTPRIKEGEEEPEYDTELDRVLGRKKKKEEKK